VNKQPRQAASFPTHKAQKSGRKLFLSHPSFKNLSLSSLSSNSWLWEFTLYHDLQKTIISSLSTKYNVFSLLSVVVTEWTQATLLFLFHLQSPSHPASHLIIQIFCQHSSVLTLASLSPVWEIPCWRSRGLGGRLNPWYSRFHGSRDKTTRLHTLKTHHWGYYYFIYILYMCIYTTVQKFGITQTISCLPWKITLLFIKWI